MIHLNTKLGKQGQDAKINLNHLPLFLKLLLVAWPVLGILPFVFLFICHLFLAKKWLISNDAIKAQVKLIYQLGLRVLALSLLVSLVFIVGIKFSWISLISVISIISLYLYMLYQLFFSIKGDALV